MGLLQRTILRAVTDGRATFLAAGAVLGIGIYGFAVTFQPYESGRVMQPFQVPQPALAAQGPAFHLAPPLAAVPGPGVASAIVDPPGAPGPVSVSLPARPESVPELAPAAALAPPPVAAAGAGSAPEPLPPVKETPRSIGPILIDPENVIPSSVTPDDAERDVPNDETSDPPPPAGDRGADDGKRDDPDGERDKDKRADSKPAKDPKPDKSNDRSSAKGPPAGKPQASKGTPGK